MNKKSVLTNERIMAIDGLRGICALIVVMGHFMVAFFPASYWGEQLPSHTLYNIDTLLAQSPLSIFFAGNYAVYIFFIITGFVLCHKFYVKGNLIQTATNRYFRLCIPILFSTLIVFIFMKLFLFTSVEAAKITGSNWLSGLYNFTPDFKEMLSITLFDVLFKGSSKYNTVFWMMSILFYGSFLVFLVVKLWGNMRNRQFIYLVLIIVFFNLNSLSYIAFILGIFCADIFVNYKHIIEKINNRIINLIMLTIGMYLGCYPAGIVPTNIFYSWLNIGDKSYQIYHILGAFLLVIAIICSDSIQKILSIRPLQYLGKISFSIFLVHIIVLCSFSCSVFVKVWNLTHKYQLSFIIAFIPSIIIIIICAHLFYRLVEQNSNKIISKIYNKFFV